MIKSITLGCTAAILLLTQLPALAVEDDGGSMYASRQIAAVAYAKASPAHTNVKKNRAKPQRTARARSRVQVVGVLPHPADCPRVAYCACGVAWELGLPNSRSLWPVSAWRQFPRDIARPNNVVFAHYSHLALLKRQISGTVWEIHNYNGQNHRSTVQIKDIAGMEIRNPRANKLAQNRS